MAVVSEGAQILHVNLCDSRFARAAHDSMFERPREKLRKYGDKVKTHCPQFIVETFAADIVNRGTASSSAQSCPPTSGLLAAPTPTPSQASAHSAASTASVQTSATPRSSQLRAASKMLLFTRAWTAPRRAASSL